MEFAPDSRQVTGLKGLEINVRAALARSHIVVLCTRCEPSITAAREASRRASAWIDGIAVLGRGGFSRSASLGMAAVAAHASARLGVDIEATSTLRALGQVPEQWLHPDERPLFRNQEECWSATAAAALWVRKEAVLKAFGVGLAVAPSAIVVGPYNEAWQSVMHPILGTAVVQSVPAPAGYALAIALLGQGGATLTCLDVSDFLEPRGSPQ